MPKVYLSLKKERIKMSKLWTTNKMEMNINKRCNVCNKDVKTGDLVRYADAYVFHYECTKDITNVGSPVNVEFDEEGLPKDGYNKRI